MYNSHHIQQFDRYADHYLHLNIVQKDVAKEIVSFFDTTDKKIIDIGCGNGEIYKNCKNKKSFIGIDKSVKMLQIHPVDSNTSLLCLDFDSDIYADFVDDEFDIALSSSSVQWSSDTEKLAKNIIRISKQSGVSLFTSGTFKTVREYAKLDNFLPVADNVISKFKDLGFNNCYTKTYTLGFSNSIDAFRYIKKCGVSSGVKRLSYSETINLINSYPLDYLEFEVVFCIRL